ncbi:hypothetical protein DFJ73DRAFT_778570 [Zopfochytrium polystomum]|nr:hypothetical protein DFJ73DRAFT_778570 [Zopfochytrium polystomum]
MEQPTAPDRESASTPDTSEEPPLVPPPATADSLTDAGPSVPQLVRDQRSHSFDADSNGQSATPTPLKKRGIATSMRLLPDSMSGSKEIAVADLAPPSPKPALHSSIIKARGAQGSGLKKRVSISNRPGVIIRATAPEPPPEESGLNASDSSGTPSDPFMTPTSPGPNPFSDAGLPLRSPLSLPPEQSSNSSFDTNDGPEGLSEPPPSPSQLADNKDTVVIRVDTNENDPPDPLTSAVSHSRAEVHVPQDGHLPVIESIQSFEAHGSTINVATDTFEGATAAAIGTAPSPAVAGTESRPAPLMVPAVERATVLKRQYTMGPTVSRPNPLMQNNPVPHHSSAAAISGVAPPAFSQSSPGLPAGDSVQAESKYDENCKERMVG